MNGKIIVFMKISFTFFLICLVTSCKNEVKRTLNMQAPEGMVWVEGKTFLQGAKEADKFAMHREMPAHEVTVDGFLLI